MKKIFIVSIILLTISLFIIIFSLIFFQHKEPLEPALDRQEEVKKIAEIIENEEIKREVWQELLGGDPSPVYRERYAIFKIPFKEIRGEFVGNIIIFPYPLLPFETLTIFVSTDLSPGKSKIEEIKGSIIQNQTQIATIDFIPQKVKERDNKFIRRWIGTKEPEDLPLPVDEYFLHLKGYGKDNVLIDEIYFKLIIKTPEEVYNQF